MCYWKVFMASHESTSTQYLLTLTSTKFCFIMQFTWNSSRLAKCTEVKLIHRNIDFCILKRWNKQVQPEAVSNYNRIDFVPILILHHLRYHRTCTHDRERILKKNIELFTEWTAESLTRRKKSNNLHGLFRPMVFFQVH